MSKLRGKIFIDKAVQGALVKRIVVHWFSFLAITVLSLTALEFLMGDPNRTLIQSLGDAWNKHAIIVMVIIALLPAFVYDTLKLSHRFAGPIFRLRTAIKQLANGDEVAPITFREKDFWAELAMDFNQVAARLQHADADGKEPNGDYETVEIAESESVFVPSMPAGPANSNQSV